MFRFRLQRVLELREQREQAQALELAKAEEAASTARTHRDELQALHEASREKLKDAHGAAATVGHLHHLGFVINALDERLGHAVKSLATAEGVVSDARSSLEAAARDRRVLDRLKNKHEDVHRAEAGHRDRVMMDEIALARFTRHREAAQSKLSSSPDEPAGTKPANTTLNSSDGISEA